MTSAHSMSPALRRLRLRALAHLLVLTACTTGCDTTPKLAHPQTLDSPYEATELWAVAPMANESGVSIVKPDRVADLFAEQIEQVGRIDCVAVNRVLMAMRGLGLRTVPTPADAVALMNTLDVDALVVGTVTAYDPYPPPKLGAAIQLYRRDGSAMSGADLDPIAVTRATAEQQRVSPAALASHGPVAQASGLFDARNHRTLAQLDEYAAGRTEPSSAHGESIYLVNMELYTQFVAFRLIRDLLDHERARVNPPQAAQKAPR